MSHNEEQIIIVENLKKTFRIPLDKSSGLKQHIVNFLKRRKGYREFRPLGGISFTVNKGEFFGIVGRNGSGKSTLLKTIAGIYNPDSGAVHVGGSLTPFIELGVGFNPELSGRENVFLNGALLGFSKKEMEAMYDDIVEFAELHDFMEERLKNYSSGMQVRLAFSIAIRANSDILLLDEVLAVGDAAFQQKCYDYFDELKKQKKTIILVTHDMEAVKRFCSRAVLIEDGLVKTIGKPDKIANQYTLDNINAEHSDDAASSTELGVHFSQLEIVPRSKQVVEPRSTYEFDIVYTLKEDLPIELGISLMTHGVSIMEHNTEKISLNYTAGKSHTVSYSLPLTHLNPGQYHITVAAFEKNGFKLTAFDSEGFNFVIDDKGVSYGGILSDKGVWKVSKRG